VHGTRSTMEELVNEKRPDELLTTRGSTNNLKSMIGVGGGVLPGQSDIVDIQKYKEIAGRCKC
jgi:hypothetical protein